MCFFLVAHRHGQVEHKGPEAKEREKAEIRRALEFGSAAGDIADRFRRHRAETRPLHIKASTPIRIPASILRSGETAVNSPNHG